MVSFDAIINSLEEAIILFDKSAKVLYLNKTAEELLRKSSKDIMDRKFSQLTYGDKSLSPLIRKTITEGRSFRGRSASLNAGRPINVDFNLSPFFANGKIDGAVLSITENINITSGDDFEFDPMVYLIGSIAHEIKNPLGGIKGAAQLLRDKTVDAFAGECIDLIVRETDRLNAILHGYLTLCKKPSFHPVNIHEVMEKALSVMSVPLQNSGITLKRFYDPSLPQVRGDEGKLLQVFLNLIKNAIEAMKKGGSIEVSTRPSRESVREGGKVKRWALVSISDTGKGIPEHELKNIFVPFYTKKKQGTGIGLALSKKIIKDHKGMIKVKSQEDKGTSFHIYIPFEVNG